MTRDRTTIRGIIIGESYPEDLTVADIVFCRVKDKNTKETCILKFKDELERRKESMQEALKGLMLKLHNTKTDLDGLGLNIVALQGKIKNTEDNLATYDKEFNIAETELQGAQAAYDKANRHSHYGGCGYSPHSNPHFNGCLDPYIDAVNKKTALRDTKKTNKEKATQDLNNYKNQLSAFEDSAEYKAAQETLIKLSAEQRDSEAQLSKIGEHIEAVRLYNPDNIQGADKALDNSWFDEL